MGKLVKNLFGIGFSALIAVITWGNLSQAQKHWVMHQVGLSFDKTLPPSTLKENTISNLIDEKTTQGPQQGLQHELRQELQQFTRAFEQHATSSLCLKTNTRSITEVDKTSIYRWTDKNGQVHFSDNKPKQQTSREVTERYASKTQYFRLNLKSPEQGLPTLLGEQLQRDVNAIYGYLSDRMEQQHLRQVDLNLKVFNTAAGFENYRKEHAPSLNSVSGFYTSLNNEAVVMQQRYDQQTRAIARHESTHVINAGLFGHSPIWFNEGLAEYFGGYTYAELKNNITPAKFYYLQHLSVLMEGNQLPSLQEYLQLSDIEWRAKDQKTMYGMAWSIIYLLQGHQKGEQLMNALMAQMAETPCSAIDAVSFWQNNYPGGLAAFENRWRVMLLSS
jgi:uncharacterized protein DUF4124/uncharacterized protein DUF1570